MKPIKSDPPDLHGLASVQRNMLRAVETPGEWWLVAEYPASTTARVSASQFRHEKEGRRPPTPGRWEYRTGRVEGRKPERFGLWAKYMPLEETS